MVNFSFADILVIGLYFILLVLIGFYATKKSKNDKSDFLLAGRSLTLPLFVMTTVATWYGGILGVGEFVYRFGINAWILQGLPYYIFAFLFAIFFSKKIRQTELFTIPERIEIVYGRKISILVSIFIFIIVSPAPYALMVGTILNYFLGIPLFYGIFGGMIISSIYLYTAGYRSDIYTDVFQFFLMFIGFSLLLFFSFRNLGDFNFLIKNLDPEYLKPFSNLSTDYIIVWFLIGLWTFVDPGFHQRSYAAKNEKVAVYGIFVSIFFWILFDFLTTTTGLYAKARLPYLENPVYSFLIFADTILPSFIKGLFFIGIFATIISTLNSFTFISAQTIGNDIFKKIIKKSSSEVQLVKLGLIITIIFSTIIAVVIPSVIELWYTIGSLFMPGILLPIIASYYEQFRLGEKRTIFQVVLVTVVTIVFYTLKLLDIGWVDMEPMIAGIITGVIFQLINFLIKEEV